MYWDNCWLNSFNKINFFNKTLFLENFFIFLFTERIYYNFFNCNFFKKITEENIFNIFLIKKNFFKKFSNKNNKKIKYNFSKIWFIKYNNCILLYTFCFFYFKIKKKKIKKKKYNLSKTLKLFFKKRKGGFFKKPLKKLKKNMVFFF
jgi:hypothetical protein